MGEFFSGSYVRGTICDWELNFENVTSQKAAFNAQSSTSFSVLGINVKIVSNFDLKTSTKCGNLPQNMGFSPKKDYHKR